MNEEDVNAKKDIMLKMSRKELNEMKEEIENELKLIKIVDEELKQIELKRIKEKIGMSEEPHRIRRIIRKIIPKGFGKNDII